MVTKVIFYTITYLTKMRLEQNLVDEPLPGGPDSDKQDFNAMLREAKDPMAKSAKMGRGDMSKRYIGVAFFWFILGGDFKLFVDC